MGDNGEAKKGQNLETIISKLSKDQPNGRGSSYLLISGLDHTNVMFHIGNEGHDSSGEDDEPDMFQCGRCKQMFTNLQRYLTHKQERNCHRRQHLWEAASSVNSGSSEVFDRSDEVIHPHSPTKRKHDRKGIARKVSTFTEVNHPSSPEGHASTGAGEPYPVPLRPFPVQGEVPITIHPNGYPKQGTPIYPSTDIRRSHSKDSMSASSPSNSPVGSPRNLTPPTMVASSYPPMPVVSSVTGAGMHPTHFTQIPGAPGNLSQVWNGPRFASVRMEGAAMMSPQLRANAMKEQVSEPPPPPPPPLLVHLKERGRPVRPRETGLTEEELTEELVTTSGTKVYRCKKCEKEFSFSSRLKRHLLVHTGARPFECQICLRRFTQAVDLKRHMLRHSGQKPHVCQYCGKQYTRGDRLKVHLTTHTDVKLSCNKPYNCSRCSAGFDEADQLRLHTCEPLDCNPNESDLAPMRVELTEEGVSETLNEDQKYEKRSPLAAKEGIVDKPFKCDECNSTFTKSTSLKSHLLKHTGEKKYKCNVCFKTFFSSSSLKIHVRVHTGDRPFKCKLCPRSFSDPSNFNKHKRWHAKQKDFLVTKPASPLPTAVETLPPDLRRKRMSQSDSIDGGYEGSDGMKEDHHVAGAENRSSSHGDHAADQRENLFPIRSQHTDQEDASRSFTSPEVLVSMDEPGVSGEEHVLAKSAE